MILFTILFLSMIILIVIGTIALVASGVTIMVTFGDVIICIIIIACIIKHFINKKRKNNEIGV